MRVYRYFKLSVTVNIPIYNQPFSNISQFIISLNTFEIRHPRFVCKLDIVGKCSQTQLCQWRSWITIIRKTTCFGTGPSSGFLLKYLGLNTIHIMRVCLHSFLHPQGTERTTAITLKPPQGDPTKKGKKTRLFPVSILRTVAPNYSPQLCSRLILPHRPTWIFSF
jgi:hypothetical protein